MKTLFALMLACAVCSANAQNSTLSNASEMSAGGSALVILGSMSAVAGSATAIGGSVNVVVASVEVVGESTVIVLKGASDAASATIKLSGQAARGVSIAAGTAVSVVTMASGYALIVAGQVIAFIPNEIGKSMLHHSPAGAYRN